MARRRVREDLDGHRTRTDDIQDHNNAVRQQRTPKRLLFSDSWSADGHHHTRREPPETLSPAPFLPHSRPPRAERPKTPRRGTTVTLGHRLHRPARMTFDTSPAPTARLVRPGSTDPAARPVPDHEPFPAAGGRCTAESSSSEPGLDDCCGSREGTSCKRGVDTRPSATDACLHPMQQP